MYLIYKATCKSMKIRSSGWYYSGSDTVSCKILEQLPTRCVELGDLSKMLSVIFLILSSEVLLRTKTLAGLAEAIRILESNKLMKVLKLSTISTNSVSRPWLTFSWDLLGGCGPYLKSEFNFGHCI